MIKVIKRLHRIIASMRNTYNCYKICRHIFNKSEEHKCGDENCQAKNSNGTPSAYKGDKYVRISKKAGHKLAKNKKSQGNVMANLAYDRGYIHFYKCDKEDRLFATLTTKGVELTDNLFLPFTPIGLWREIYKDHRIFGKLMVTIISTLVVSISGIGIALAYRLSRFIIGT